MALTRLLTTTFRASRAKCLIADGKWTILMSKIEAKYRTHMEISIILLVKMIEAFVTIESALNASRGLVRENLTNRGS